MVKLTVLWPSTGEHPAAVCPDAADARFSPVCAPTGTPGRAAPRPITVKDHTKAAYWAASAAVILATVTGCGGGSSPGGSAAASHSPAAPASPAASSSPAEPETAAAALSAAKAYFALYAAGQYAAVYPMIAPTDRGQISESVWVALHRKCVSHATAGLSYSVTSPVLAGTTVVVTVSLAGIASSIGSEQISFTYSGGQWYYQPSDLSIYKGHDLAEAVAALKADGGCQG